jgi:hypothetical protein
LFVSVVLGWYGPFLLWVFTLSLEILFNSS